MEEEGPKLKFLLRFDENVEYKRPAGAYPLRDFYKICRVCTSFQDALAVKIWLDFVCLSVCLSVYLFVTLLNVRVCTPDFTTKALKYRNDFDAVG